MSNEVKSQEKPQVSLTKEDIREKLLTNDNWLMYGLLAIYERQTDSEKENSNTVVNNGVGFNGSDVRFLTSMASFVHRKKHWFMNRYAVSKPDLSLVLTPKQKNVVRKMMLKYSGQLLKIATGKL